MIGLDTNVLLRATLNDDPVQSPAAQRLLRSLDEGQAGLVNIPVLMEFFWVLRSRYKLPPDRLAAAVRDLLEVQSLEVESLEVVGKALAAFEAREADFPDMIIALRNRELGAEPTFTFDKNAAASVPAMELLS